MADGSVKIEITADDSDAKKALDNVEEAAEDAAGGLEDLGDSAGSGSKGLGILDVAAGNLVSGGISALISGLGNAIQSLINLADETREFREDMAKLETAFTTTGHTSEDASKAYEDFYAILGESDRSVEAVNHLAELTNNTEELSQWSTIAAGVTAKFGDSLPIEGLTEAANETAKVGQVTGPLADALNWVSKESSAFGEALGGNKAALAAFNKALKDGENVEDAFSAALSKMSTEQERSAAITNTLNGVYAEAAGEYNALTAETQAARRATAEMEEAQARLGAAVEPLSTGITTLKTGCLNLGATVLESVVTPFTTAKDTTILLNDEQTKLIDSTLAAAEKMRELKLAADEASIGISSEFNYTQTLANELLTLADANGRVQEADKARVEYILGELNSALGTEYTMTGNIISNYATLKDSIYEVIEAKRAQTLLQEYEETYAAAVKNVAEQEEARANAAIEAGAKLAEFEAEKLAAKEARIAYEQKVLDGASDQYIYREGQRIVELEKHVQKTERELEKAQDKYAETSNAVDESYAAINAYEQASTLILEGETGKAITLLNNYGNGFTEAAGKTGKATKEEIENLKNRVINTSTQLGLLEAEYKKNQGNMTAEQKKQMEARIEAAKKEAQDAMTEAKTIGGNLIEGIEKGANNKEWVLTGALKGVVSRAIEAAKKVAKIKSPSRVMRDEVGEMLIAGLELGIEKNRNAAINAMKNVSTDTIAVMKDTASAEIKAVEDKTKAFAKAYEKETKELKKAYDAQDKELQKQRNKNNEEQIQAQRDALREQFDLNEEARKEQYELDKEALADELAVAKERERAINTAANTLEKQLADMVKIEENYVNDVAKTKQKLVDDTAKAWETYENAVASRTTSIKNELGLFDMAEKGDAVKGKDLLKAAKSQISILEDYNAALETLSGKGVNQEFIDELKGMGVDALPQLEAINKMTDKELAEYVGIWEDKNELAKKAALSELEPLREATIAEVERLNIETDAELAKLKEGYKTSMIELMAEMGLGMSEAGDAGLKALGDKITSYVNIGKNLMEGLGEGISSAKDGVVQNVIDNVVAAIEAAKDAAGIHSPSTVMRDEVGKNMGLGLAEGLHRQLSNIKKTMAADLSTITASVRASVMAENARMGQHVTGPDTGISDVIRAVGMQTAGINSLASKYDRGTGSMRPIIIQLDKRELGRAVVDVGSAEEIRVGAKLAY